MSSVKNWFDPRNRAPALKYDGELPAEDPRAAPAGPAVALAGRRTMLDGNLDPARERQPAPEPQLLRVINLDAVPQQDSAPQGGPTEGERAHQQLMQEEMDRERQQAFDTFQKLQAVYQRLFNKH